MLDFLKTLYRLRREKVTLILWEDSNPDDPQSYQIRPSRLLFLGGILVLFLVVLINITLIYTPLGGFLTNRVDAQFRQDLIEISTRVLELQDSLQVRDDQLTNMREVFRTAPDTIFQVNLTPGTIPVGLSGGSSREGSEIIPLTYDFLRQPDVTFDSYITESPVFPVPLPVDGMLTSMFQPESGHFGIDIAANAGTPIRTVADGIVTSSEWTINYGYVMSVQHADGYLSIYKHLSSPIRKTGDIIRKGDILGGVSDSGVISSGPHLHFELWRNGRPLNPMNYVIN